MDTLKIFVEHLAPVAAIILAGVATVAARAFVRWLAAKVGVERAAEVEAYTRMVVDVVDDGIGYAEQHMVSWARERGELTSGERKLELAVEWVARELRRRGLPELARDEIVDLIEARLGRPDTPGASRRGEVAVDLLELEENAAMEERLRPGGAS